MPEGSSEIAEFDYLTTVKVLLGISGEELDAVLPVYISMVKQAILNYCNIWELPEELNYTLCQMTADSYRDITAGQSTGEVKGNVSSISEDGRSVSFGSGAEFKTALADRITRTTELNRFKRLYRIKHEPEGRQAHPAGSRTLEEEPGGDVQGAYCGA